MFQRRTVTPSAGGVLGLPTPLARLYGTAMVAGIAVIDIPDATAGDLPQDTAAVVGWGSVIAMHPDLDDELRADVLAMALSVASGMRHRGSGHSGDLSAPDGFAVITLDRLIPAPRTGPGRIATRLARKCGRETASAAFGHYAAGFGHYLPEPGGEDDTAGGSP